MKEIPLTQSKVALVDDVDYDWLNQHKWYAHNDGKNFYAIRNSSQKKGKRFVIQMSREILGLGYKDKRQGDHENHNTLDNRRDNLRICTSRQNNQNRKSILNSSSRFKGVTWNKPNKKWLAQIKIKGIVNYLGLWNLEELAALAYDMVAIREHGEFAHLNFN